MGYDDVCVELTRVDDDRRSAVVIVLVYARGMNKRKNKKKREEKSSFEWSRRTGRGKRRKNDAYGGENLCKGPTAKSSGGPARARAYRGIVMVGPGAERRAPLLIVDAVRVGRRWRRRCLVGGGGGGNAQPADKCVGPGGGIDAHFTRAHGGADVHEREREKKTPSRAPRPAINNLVIARGGGVQCGDVQRVTPRGPGRWRGGERGGGCRGRRGSSGRGEGG